VAAAAAAGAAPGSAPTSLRAMARCGWANASDWGGWQQLKLWWLKLWQQGQ